MKPERLALIDPLYPAALDKLPQQRSPYLASWRQIAVTRDNNVLTAPQAPPAAIGRYRILRLLGQGGMGAVYAAEQEQPRRTVALKIIKSGVTSPALLRRFQQEFHALGRLHHPGIAQIYEAGSADSAFGPHPYFAMELIEGLPLSEFAEAHRLSTRERLELMARVCDAVQHAHQRGIIHRDLKPGNILVEESGQPKILDFGVARVTDNETQVIPETDVGQIVGTLAYMSPEQVSGDPREVDRRSDVYSLGMILYELLAKRLPYDVGYRLQEALQTIRETDPLPLSLVAGSYRGDIQTIVEKALEKDKQRRYASASDLAGDIRRYLADQPIVARPPSANYHLLKFARRRKGPLASVAAVLAALVGGAVVSTWEAVRADRAEAQVLLERDRAIRSSALEERLLSELLNLESQQNAALPHASSGRDFRGEFSRTTASANAGRRPTGASFK